MNSTSDVDAVSLPNLTFILVMQPFALISPATRGLSLSLTRHLLRTTDLPVYATYRSGNPHKTRQTILAGVSREDVDPSRLNLLPLDLASEESIKSAASSLAEDLEHRHEGKAHLHTAFFTGGVLHPERQPADLDLERLNHTFQINTLAHLLLIKHFSQFLPKPDSNLSRPAKWVHLSARVGSISDNQLGGWYSYRASKAALNQIVKTFDLHLQARRIPAIAVGMHPGTVKTNFSKDFWSGVKEGQLFEPKYAAEKVASVVDKLTEGQRGRTWDWKGEEIMP